MSTTAWQRVEGAGLALGGLLIAVFAGPGWTAPVWIAILLAPDLSMAGYLAGPRAGAFIYNLAHVYALPFLAMVVGVAFGAPALIAAGGLWLSHIGADRALGYGLKANTGFRDTHLGRIGREGR
ncbi:protein of unknown function [Paracoccus halophilus]|uniref:DUF4260 domain-containing protein n=1 Tax=Paracoccus halophilus TaxID=376733 RepID=A0A099F1S8_9RHOB|nr:DUF4260 domain-containing protein [Paracoccus halophilus]KGJ04640.1 hypothetical protein IT41_09795 [Paracoccus halophilus]SFA49925.1 protein of unknown function [Paracoccus halophilus]